MRHPPLIFFLLFPVVLLTACAAGPGTQRAVPQEPSPPPVEGPAPASSSAPFSPAPAPEATGEREQELPALPLSGELLYQILEAEMALQRQLYGLGISRYQQLAAVTRDPRFAERAAHAAFFIHDDAATLRAARLWVELEPARSEPHQMMVVAAVRNGSLEEALKHMEFLLSSADQLPEERFELMANLLSREHDVQEAYRLMERFISARRDSPSALYAYAHLAMRAGELEKAREAIDDALDLRPGWYDAIALRIRVLLLSDGADAAMEYLKEAVDEYPDDTQLRLAYARTLVEVGRHEDALEQYEALLGAAPSDAEILFAMSMIYLQLDRMDEAEETLLRLRDASANGTPDLQFYLGWIAERRGDAGQAIAHYASVPPEAQNHLEARIRVAVLTASEGDLASARRQLQVLRAAEPAQQRRLYQIEAELLRQADHREEGMDVLNAALQIFPGDFELLYARALLAESIDRLDIVESDLRYIIEREPDHVDALNALGYTLADRTDRYREAYEYISRALELNPENHAILDSMGWVLYRMGNHDEAIKYLRRSLEMRRDHEVAAHLGEVLWVTGEREEAKAVWQRALDEFPGQRTLLETMKRFGQ